MTVYSYSPPRGNTAAKILTWVLVAAALILMVAGSIFPDLDPILKTSAFALMMAAVLVCTRFMLLGYTYSVETSDSGAPDLVIVENKGKVNRTVCRVSIAGGRLYPSASSVKIPAGKKFDYRTGLAPSEGCVFRVPERDGGDYVLFCPDEKLRELMISLGASVEE